jgi:hypothetical protein
VHLKIALKKPSTIVCIWKDLQALLESSHEKVPNGIATVPRDLSDYQKLFYQLFPVILSKLLPFWIFNNFPDGFYVVLV